MRSRGQVSVPWTGDRYEQPSTTAENAACAGIHIYNQAKRPCENAVYARFVPQDARILCHEQILLADNVCCGSPSGVPLIDYVREPCRALTSERVPPSGADEAQAHPRAHVAALSLQRQSCDRLQELRRQRRRLLLSDQWLRVEDWTAFTPF